MDEKTRARVRQWLAIARVGNAVGHGVGPRYRTLSGEPGANLARAFAHPDEVVRLSTERFDWAEAFRRAATRLDAAEQEIARAEAIGARVLDIEDPSYPYALAQIADPPPVLFVLGALEACDARAVAVVGARAATEYGLKMTRRLVPSLVAHQITIVSGMARGIDGAAHQVALDQGGRTLAVLGTGVDVPYPLESRAIYDAIPTRGAVLSELPPGTRAQGPYFLARNRIISGLAKAVVVVEARRQSGTLNTAMHARNQGRDLYAFPGDADLARSQGTNELLAEGGAWIVREAPDILLHTFHELYAHPDVAKVEAEPALDGAERSVYFALDGEPSTVDALLGRVGIPVPRLLAALSGLERRGIVARDEQGRYARFGKTASSG